MQYRITCPVKGYNGNVVGVMFDKGVAVTDGVGTLAYFKRHGYKIEEVEEAEEPGIEDDGDQGSDDDAPKGPNLADMKVDELKAFAEAESIDLGDATKKDDIRDAIASALAAKE